MTNTAGVNQVIVHRFRRMEKSLIWTYKLHARDAQEVKTESYVFPIVFN